MASVPGQGMASSFFKICKGRFCVVMVTEREVTTQKRQQEGQEMDWMDYGMSYI